MRLVWTAGNPHAYNISVPLVQVAACALRDSKVGHAIVVEVHKLSGGYKLGAYVLPVYIKLPNTDISF